MKRYLFLAAVLGASLLRTEADSTERKRKLEEEFSRVPVPELGARAALLVRSAPAYDREETAVAAVETVLQRNPAAAVTVVAAISKAAPETARAVVAAANRVAPASSEHVLIAARNAAPSFRDSFDSSSNVIPSRHSDDSSGHGNNDGDKGNSGNNAGADHSREGGEIHHDGELPNGKPFPPIQSHRPPHPEHPQHPPHPPHPVKYNQPHEHDHDADDDHGHNGGEDHDHGRNEHGHDRD